MGLSQRNKGKRGEREAAKLLTALGLPARRARQSDGKLDADLVIEGRPDLYVEVKFCDSVSLDAWLAKATADSVVLDTVNEAANVAVFSFLNPVVIHRRANKPWKVTMTPEAFVRLVNRG